MTETKTKRSFPFKMKPSSLHMLKNCFICACICMAVSAAAAVAVSGQQSAADDEVWDMTVFPEAVFTDIRNPDETAGPELFSEAPLTAVNVWETTCGFCIQEMPDLNKIASEYKGKVNLIGICFDTVYDGSTDPDAVRLAEQIMTVRGVGYKNYIPDEVFSSYLLNSESFSGFPTTFFVDGNRNIVKVITGALSYDGWVNAIDSLLAETDINN